MAVTVQMQFESVVTEMYQGFGKEQCEISGNHRTVQELSKSPDF